MAAFRKNTGLLKPPPRDWRGLNPGGAGGRIMRGIDNTRRLWLGRVMQRITFATALAVFSLAGSVPIHAEDESFYYKTDGFSRELLKPWVKVEAQSHYAGIYHFESGDAGGLLVVNVLLKPGKEDTKDLLLDAVKIGPASILDKKPVKTFADFTIGKDGVARIDGKEVMRACTFVHPESKKELRGFLIGSEFFGEEG
jgi:hypothetical protein